ncbi:hypothetical protein ACQ86N_23345 [Puia sp. P3]|uniref:hypothetical protein n=1 Tax=Puia sp. P3 TaxID=3423952 RepID=UPI003D6793DE
MKHSYMLTGIAVILISLFVQYAAAQTKTGDGFWVVESSLAAPRDVTVRFYGEGSVLIYEEHLMGVRMDVGKRRTRRKLDGSLLDARAAWQVYGRATEDRGIVAARFGVDPGGTSSWSSQR